MVKKKIELLGHFSVPSDRSLTFVEPDCEIRENILILNGGQVHSHVPLFQDKFFLLKRGFSTDDTCRYDNEIEQLSSHLLR